MCKKPLGVQENVFALPMATLAVGPLTEQHRPSALRISDARISDIKRAFLPSQPSWLVLCHRLYELAPPPCQVLNGSAEGTGPDRTAAGEMTFPAVNGVRRSSWCSSTGGTRFYRGDSRRHSSTPTAQGRHSALILPHVVLTTGVAGANRSTR
jgi:hypothetical protein